MVRVVVVAAMPGPRTSRTSGRLRRARRPRRPRRPRSVRPVPGDAEPVDAAAVHGPAPLLRELGHDGVRDLVRRARPHDVVAPRELVEVCVRPLEPLAHRDPADLLHEPARHRAVGARARLVGGPDLGGDPAPGEDAVAGHAGLLCCVLRLDEAGRYP